MAESDRESPAYYRIQNMQSSIVSAIASLVRLIIKAYSNLGLLHVYSYLFDEVKFNVAKTAVVELDAVSLHCSNHLL